MKVKQSNSHRCIVEYQLIFHLIYI